MTEPGIYPNMPMAEYLTIPALSAGIARTLVDRCPAAAWWESYLNPQPAVDDSDASDLGTIAHAILLEGTEDGCAVIDPADHPNEKGGGFAHGWTNKSIKAARDAARADGKVPILLDDMQRARTMVESAQAFIASLAGSEPAVFDAFCPDGGLSEVTVVWGEAGTLCKARADRLSRDNGLIIDFKTSAMSVEPDAWGRRQMANMGYYVSAAWYRRGVLAATGVEPDYVFLATETMPPHLCSLIGVDPAALELGTSKIERALQLWRKHTASGTWPAYPNKICYPELPAWESARWQEREIISWYGSQA